MLVAMGVNNKWLDSKYTLKVEQRGFIDGFQMEWERRESGMNDPKISDLSNWKDGANPNCDEECCLGCSGGAPFAGKTSSSVSDVL